MQKTDNSNCSKEEDFDEMLELLIKKTAKCSLAVRKLEDSVIENIIAESEREENDSEGATGFNSLKLNATYNLKSDCKASTKDSLEHSSASEDNESYTTAMQPSKDSSEFSDHLTISDSDGTTDGESDGPTVERESPLGKSTEAKIMENVAHGDILSDEEEEGACALPLSHKSEYEAAAEEQLDWFDKEIDAYVEIHLRRKQSLATGECSIMTTPGTSAVPKLVFFDERGSAETLRYLFAYGRITYHDVRITQLEWEDLKKCKPVCRLPMLIIGDTIIQQIVPIARYLGTLSGIGGSTPLEAMKIDAIVEEIEELRVELLKAYVNYEIGLDEVKMRDLKNHEVLNKMNMLELSVMENNGYLVLKDLTWADIFFMGTIEYFDFLKGFDIFDGYKGLRRNVEMIKRLSGIRHWIKRRPETDN